MKFVRGFFMFWYDFIIGDSWELALGVVIALVVTAVLVATPLRSITWLLLPLMIGLALVGSLLWFMRNERP